ncbi:MAG TPA: class I SAM-dependent methyltransferase [Crocinitomix sp.]|nr:class I SAM-dependent methyltransferase [Crocinitomix sp.]
MNELYHISNCPICNATAFEKFLEAKDYTVSQKMFTIVECKNCGFHFTNPIPKLEDIGSYYKAESYVSHTSTNKGLINKIYQLVRSYTLKQKVKLISKLANGKQLLDIGAGTGHFINAATSANFNALGLEPDEDARQLAKELHKANIKPIEELYKLKDDSMDIITMWHVLEHVYHLKDDLKQITSVLKHNGTLIIAVPNMSAYDAKKYKSHWAAYDLPIHLYHFQPKDIKNLFEQYNMRVDKILPMKFDSFYVSMLSEKYKGGNLFSAFYTGLKSNLKAKQDSYSSQIYILRKNVK